MICQIELKLCPFGEHFVRKIYKILTKGQISVKCDRSFFLCRQHRRSHSI